MNNKTSIMLAIVGCLTITQLGHASGRDTTVKTILNCVGYVTGGCVTGDITMGAAGDKVSINTEGLPVENFGVISRLTQKSITVPVSGKKLFALTPTEGQYANKMIKVLFYTLDLTKPFPADTPSNMAVTAQKALANPEIAPFAKSMTCVYRQGPGETQWTSFYETVTDDTQSDLANAKAIRLVINATGKVIAYLPSYQQALSGGGTSKIGATPLIVELGRDPETILP